MRILLPLSAVSLALAGLLAPLVAAHGGAYRGPGDNGVPPASPGGASGAPTAPTPAGGAAPAGGGARSGGAGGGGSSVGGAAPSAPQGGGASAGPDITRWQTWWGFNKDGYLDLKARVHFSEVLAGSDESFLGGKSLPLTRDDLRPSEESVRTRIVPALVRALREERSNDIASGALIALAKIGDAPGEDEFGPLIARFVAHPNQELAETAAVALGILGNDANIELLAELLRGEAPALIQRGIPLAGSPSERTRAFAAYGLGLIGAGANNGARGRIVEALIGWMQREQAGRRQSEIPVGCTIALGLVPLPLDPLSTPPAAGIALQRPAQVFSREQQVLWLLQVLGERSQATLVRAHAPTSVARLVGDLPDGHWLRWLAVRELVACLERRANESSLVRSSCVLALGAIGDGDGDRVDVAVRAALQQVRGDARDASLENLALIALAQVAGRPGSGPEPLAALERPGSVRDYLRHSFATGASGTRCWSALALGVLERSLADARQPVSPDTSACLRSALAQARAPDEVGAYAIALGIARDVGARALLRAKLDEVADQDARGHVAVALGLTGDAGAIERVAEIIAKSRYQPELLRQAAIALGLLGDKHVVAQLIDMLASASSLSSQAAIASALGLIGDARSIDPLIAMLADQEGASDLARAFAAVALGICADKEALPWNAKVSAGSNYSANTATLYSPDTGTGILDLL